MNNSKIALDGSLAIEEPKLDVRPKLREREATVVRIIEAIRGIKQSAEWSTLKSEIFDALTDRFSRELTEEAKKEQADPLKLNRIAGQLKWAERYSDLGKLEEQYLTELSGIRKQLDIHG
jgi:phage terminase small subunit